nr:MAG TPA: hypothetical protein [Caudoviricetes sp.]
MVYLRNECGLAYLKFASSSRFGALIQTCLLIFSRLVKMKASLRS